MNAHADPRYSKPRTEAFVGLPDNPAMQLLRSRPQWVCWDHVWRANLNKPGGGDWTKPPMNPRTGEVASATDPEVWSDYETAARGVSRYELAGVGFALSPDDNLTGIDLDHCRNKETGELQPWAAEIVALNETYVEVSPSGEGLRLISAGKEDKAIKFDPAQVEIYGTSRYLTITGQHLPGTPDRIQPAPKTT
jgi:primase-polymerase (primpol)-like protein